MVDFFFEQLMFFAKIGNEVVLKVADHKNEFIKSKFKMTFYRFVTRADQARTQACVEN